ncbi:DUF222 domain-containing protein [Mycobacterium sp. smrl_JER01]|uniref:HNH endonuclease signature motif containing protein n=1 Tax=Mycobacterium sp. smrl_JER01 TaxID=3402633 RepID=UPI003AC8594B
MCSAAASLAPGVSCGDRLEVLFDELAELTGQRNAIDGQIVQIAAQIDREGLWGATGARSLAGLMAWKTGSAPRHGKTIAAIAARLAEFPRCTEELAAGRLSLDQVGVIAEGAGAGSDEHYAELASVATVGQLRTAIKLEPRPDTREDPDPDPDLDDDPRPAPTPPPRPSISKTCTGEFTCWKITLPTIEAALFEAALRSHHDALITQWRHDHPTEDHPTTDSPDPDSPDLYSQEPTGHGDAGEDGRRPPMPDAAAAFMELVTAGWDAEATRRPHGHHTTVVVHVDIAERVAALHLGPTLTTAQRQYLSCDATCEVWFNRDGQPLGAARTTRTISRRLRRALEHRDRTCVIPGCAATRGLHAHHITHWEDGGPTELDNLVLVCPYHHRCHHRGLITITGPAPTLTITDATGREITPRSLARPPTTTPPTAAPYPGPTGERAHWWWYQPFQPPPATTG